MMSFLVIVAFSVLIFEVCLTSTINYTFYKRGSPGKSTPSHQPISNQQQPADSFSSFQDLLKLNPDDLKISFGVEVENSATSHLIRNVPQKEDVTKAKRKRGKRADDYNLKRRLKRAQLKANDPIAYQQGLEEEKAKNLIRRKRRKELALANSPSSESTAKNRAAIRKRVREGKGTKEDKEYVDQLRIQNKAYRRRKSYEDLLKGMSKEDRSDLSSKESHQ